MAKVHTFLTKASQGEEPERAAVLAMKLPVILVETPEEDPPGNKLWAIAPPDHPEAWLDLFDDQEQARAFCAEHGLPVVEACP